MVLSAAQFTSLWGLRAPRSERIIPFYLVAIRPALEALEFLALEVDGHVFVAALEAHVATRAVHVVGETRPAFENLSALAEAAHVVGAGVLHGAVVENFPNAFSSCTCRPPIPTADVPPSNRVPLQLATAQKIEKLVITGRADHLIAVIAFILDSGADLGGTVLYLAEKLPYLWQEN